MTHGPTNFPTKGKCIYCGASDVKLSDEHIVPLAFGGQHVIQEASCSDCAKITSKFEAKVMRGMWGDARISYEARTRHKKQRPKFISMTDAKDPGRKIQIPPKEYPGGFAFYKMQPPGLLQGLGEEVDILKTSEIIMIDDEKRRNEFLKKYPDTLTLSFRHHPEEFAQLLCKVAYCHLLTQLDLDDFDPICLPYMMGAKKNLSYVVGGTLEDVVPILGAGYFLNASGFISSDVMTLIVKVRLLANTEAPEYQVVVGKVTGSKKIPIVLKKLGEVELERIPI